MKRFIAGQNDAGQRLDKFLSKLFKDVPMGMIYKWLRKKRVKVNGKKQEISYILNEGDVLELYINDEFFEIPDEKTSFLKITEPSIDIVYEDNNIILMDKKPGVIVHDDEDEKRRR